jgi:hypothetical protein
LGVSPINNGAFEITTKTGDTAQIGDPTKPTFSPEITLTRWNGECKLKLAFDDSTIEPASKTVQHSEAEVRLNTPLLDFIFYEVDKDDTALEEEIILKTKPVSNKIIFINQSKNLIAYHQPPLSQEFNAEDCVELSETHALLKSGGEYERPIHVVNSIAFYHGARGNLHAGAEASGKYKAGKAFHLYRPECIDAEGKHAWADFALDANGNIVMTLPEGFLDSAKYPVVVDPTFGYTSVGASENGLSGTMGCSFQAPDAGTLTSVSLYTKNVLTGEDKLAAGGVYSDSDGSVGTRLGYEYTDDPIPNDNVYHGWFPCSPLSIQIAAGTNYWFTESVTSDGWFGVKYDSGDTNQAATSSDNEPPPITLSNPAYSNRRYSIYATYTAGGTLQTVTDALSLSDLTLRDKPLLTIADTAALSESSLRDKALTMTDSLNLVDLVTVLEGAVIQAVSDIIGLADEALTDRSIATADTVHVLDAVFRHKSSILVSDLIHVVEAVLATKLLVATDSVSLVDLAKVLKLLNAADTLSFVDSVSTSSRVLNALDAVKLADGAFISKMLQINETISLVEVVEAGVGGVKKTRLFLILGDLAVQLTGD